MKIAVLMSTYNGHKYLDKQLKSIAEQTVVNHLTLYIRDDGSKDDTFDIIDKWKNKINIVLYKEKNAGPAMSFWQLLMKSEVKADYYAFCDQDDIWYENKIDKAVKTIRNKKGPILYCSDCEVINEKDVVIKETYQNKRPVITLESQLVCGSMQGCSMLFNNELKKIIVRYKSTQIPMHDIVIMYIALINGKVIYDKEPLFGYRMHSNNVVAKDNKSILKRLKSTYILWFESGKKYPIEEMVNDLLNNYSTILKYEDIEYLNLFLNYKRNIIKKIKIVFNSKTESSNQKGLRSFRIRVLLGII